MTSSIEDLIKSNKRLANEIQDGEIKSYTFVKCWLCERNGSSLKAISYGYDVCYICADCLIEGKFVNIIKFAWLTQEGADYVRYQIQKPDQQNLNGSQFRRQIDLQRAQIKIDHSRELNWIRYNYRPYY